MRSLPCLVLLVAACSSNPTGDQPDPGAVLDANNGGGGGGGGSGTPDGGGTTSADDPANDGTATYTTSTVTITGVGSRKLPSTVFTPSTTGPHPLVIISCGLQMDRAQYTSYAKHLASWDFAVVLTDYADKNIGADHAKLAADIKSAIDWSVAQTSLAVDPAKIAVAGHSLGGKVSTFAASLDARIKAVVGWDPVDSSNAPVVPERMSTVTAAMAVIGETTNETGVMPCSPKDDNFKAFYAAAPSPAYSLQVGGGAHMDWVDDSSCFFCGFCGKGTAPATLTHTVTRRVNVAWLRRLFFADMTMDKWLDMPPEAGLTVQRK